VGFQLGAYPNFSFEPFAFVPLLLGPSVGLVQSRNMGNLWVAVLGGIELGPVAFVLPTPGPVEPA
jgi:hypothetical protein